MGSSGSVEIKDKFDLASIEVAPTRLTVAPGSSSRSIEFFDRPYELAQIWFPIGLLVIALIEIVYSHRYFSDDTLALNFIQNVLFLNSLHVVFTYLILFTNSGGRAWAQSAFSSYVFRARCAIVFLFFAGLYYFYLRGAAQYSWATTVIDGVMIVIGRHHEISQSRGVSLLYDSRLTGEIRQSVFGHRLFPAVQWVQTLFGYSGSLFSFLTLATYQVNSPIYNYAKHEFRSPVWYWMWIGGFVVSLLCLIFIFYSVQRIYPKELRRKKYLFNMRYPIKLLSYHSSLAAFFSNGTHGVEYLAVYTKIDRAKERTLSKKAFILTLCLSVALFVFLRYSKLFAPYLGLEESSSFVNLGMALIAGFTFLHYFLDAHLFKHSDPKSKELIISRLKS